MKNLKFKILFMLLVIVSGLFSQEWSPNPANPNQNIQRAGKVAIGSWYLPDDPSAWYKTTPASQPGPNLEISSTNNLGINGGDYALLTSASGPVGVFGQSGWIHHNTWVFRNWTDPNTSISSAGIHDGIGYNGSYKNPSTDSKTWWRRMPDEDVQWWGNDNSAHLRLAHGKVGIGTPYDPDGPGAWYNGSSSSPQLEVWNPVPLGVNPGSRQLIASFTASVTGNRIHQSTWLTRNGNQLSGWQNTSWHDGISVDASFITPGTDTRTWWERDPANGNQSWGDANVTHMLLSGGRLAINSYAPLARLDIAEQDMNYMSCIIRSAHTSPGQTAIYASIANDLTSAIKVGAENFNSQNGNWMETFTVLGNGKTSIRTNQTDALTIEDISSTSIVNFKIQKTGKTIIGNQIVPSRPGSLLSVSGEIDCKSLYVLKPTTWQDKVFEKSYKLQSLSEVEDYVKKNKHLPGIESETEIIEKGYDVNKMDAQLLEKIENLYLYAIEQQKEIERLKLLLKNLK